MLEYQPLPHSGRKGAPVPIAPECYEDHLTNEGETLKVFRKDCAFDDLVAQGKVLTERQLNDLGDIAFKLTDDEWGRAYFLVRVPEEARGPQGWHAVDDPKLQKKVVKIARQRYGDWLRENGDDEE